MQKLLSKVNPHLLIALALAFAFHGGLSVSGTYKRTYDAYVHIFFADHYARAWFDHWEYRWYTGFPMTSYPPGSQQSVALLSLGVGLLNGFVIVQTFAIMNVVLGIYRFSKIWVSEEAAGYAALLTVFASSINETVHVFGQLPTMFSLGFLLNAIPYAHEWFRDGKMHHLYLAWVVTAATTAGHHVTTLFGSVFFLAPVMGMSILEKFRLPLPDEPPQHPVKITRANLRPLVTRRLRRILPVVIRCGVYGVGMIVLLLVVVLPYWLWSRSDPITQVSIPHASRDSFIVNTAAGLVFWLIPYGTSLLVLPYVAYKGFTTKAWPMALSWAALVVLGTGGTTPIPKLLLRGAFDILTLDRFTFWATILSLPLMGEFVASIRSGRFARYLREQFGDFTWRLTQVSLVMLYLGVAVFTANLTHFRKFQPDAINMQPIVNFIQKDQHWRWRYLTLGFGDQVAWLAAQTTATSVDGNYHSARRLPELTSTPVERLEGAKFSGVPGLGSLQQFLAVPDKYNLKFVFSNDQFYDPLLYFSGWHRLGALENGIFVWEREDIPPLPEVLPRKEIPIYQRIMWGVLPMSMVMLALTSMAAVLWGGPAVAILRAAGWLGLMKRIGNWFSYKFPPLVWVQNRWRWLMDTLLAWSQLPEDDQSEVTLWQVWLEWFNRLQFPQPAPPSARLVRTALLITIVLTALGGGAFVFYRQARSPETVVEGYYDDLDFRRFESAYERLDPETRSDFEQYLLDLSVTGGLLASYAKLDSVLVKALDKEPAWLQMQVDTDWITALKRYQFSEIITLVKRDGRWYIEPKPVDIKIPPDEFFRQPVVDWRLQERRRVTSETTSLSDVLDRPEVEILSARLVRYPLEKCPELLAADPKLTEAFCIRYSVVGELVNTDVDPADITVTVYLFDEQGNELTWYNAQYAIIHKLLPKEVTPFRVDFEGVAGSVLRDDAAAGEFQPDLFSPTLFDVPVARFEVYAKAVVTSRDLYRDVAVQNLQVTPQDTGLPLITGDLINNGTLEATIPHLLVTYYDASGSVVWVEDSYLDVAVRSQRTQPFQMNVVDFSQFETLQVRTDLYANALFEFAEGKPRWQEPVLLEGIPWFEGYRVNVHYFVGAAP